MLSRGKIYFALLFMLVLTAGCAQPASPEPPPAQPTETRQPALETPPATAAPQQISIYLVAIEDNGRTGEMIGCGDSLVAVPIELPDQGDPINAALSALLFIDDRFYGGSGLYNALYQSDLTIDSIEVDEQGRALVRLAGDLVLGGACDSPRVEAQIKETVLQFAEIDEVSVTINEEPLEQILSERG